MLYKTFPIDFMLYKTQNSNQKKPTTFFRFLKNFCYFFNQKKLKKGKTSLKKSLKKIFVAFFIFRIQIEFI